jgi:hypothetical protein
VNSPKRRPQSNRARIRLVSVKDAAAASRHYVDTTGIVEMTAEGGCRSSGLSCCSRPQHPSASYRALGNARTGEHTRSHVPKRASAIPRCHARSSHCRPLGRRQAAWASRLSALAEAHVAASGSALGRRRRPCALPGFAFAGRRSSAAPRAHGARQRERPSSPLGRYLQTMDKSDDLRLHPRCG